MKRISVPILLALFVYSNLYADVPISGLPAGTTLSGTEQLPAVQTGVTVKTTPAAINTYVQGQTTSTTIIGKFTSCTGTKVLAANGTCINQSTGTVTSVAATVPSGFSIIGSPITTSGTLAISGVLNPVAGGTGAATLSGVLKGNGISAISAAGSSDVIGLWTGTCTGTNYLAADGTCVTPTAAGVTSVAFTAPSVFTVSGSPVTTSGTLGVSFATGQTQNQFLASPNGSSGIIGLREIVAADIPSISSGLNGTLPIGNGGTGAVTLSGVLKGNGVSALSAATSSDVISLWSGTCNSGTYLRADGSCQATPASPPAGSTYATQYNDSGTLGGAGPGTAGQVLTSNGAAAPTFQGVTLPATVTGTHDFTGAITFDSTTQFNGTSDFSDTLTISSALLFDTAGNSTLAAGTTNNANPTGLGNKNILRLTADSGGSTITGFVAQASGYTMWVYNIQTAAAGTLTFPPETGSSAANQIITPAAANFVVPPGGGAMLRYDGTTTRWRIVGIAAGGSVAGSDTQIQFNDGGAFGADADYAWNKTTNTLTIGSTSVPGIITGASNSGGAGALLTVLGSASTNSGSAGGALAVTGGTSSEGAGGAVTLTGGIGVTASAANRAGGAVALVGGASVTASTGGAANVTAGAGGATGQGGGATMTGGAGGATSGNGGDSTVQGGAAGASGAGGGVSISGRTGVGTAKNGGGVTLNTGAASDANGTSGTIQFQAWQSDTTYDLQVPTTGFSLTCADRKGILILNPAGTLATGTVTLPAKPNNGQIIRVATSQIITALTVSANSGQTISNAPTTLAAGAGFTYIYNTSGTNWFRLQ